jgi:colanic acid/amylovoran biosynthesis glycosyltransferase
MRVGYLSRVLPALSETFVISEIVALRSTGVEIVPFSVHAPKKGDFQDNAQTIFEETTVINDPSRFGFWVSNLLAIFTNFFRYFSTLYCYVILPKLSVKNRLRAFTQFLVAAEAARLFKKEKVTIIHAHFAHIATGIAMMAAKLINIPYSFTIHAYGLFRDNMLLSEKLRDAAFVATVSNYNINYIEEHYPDTDIGKIHLVRCTVNSVAFTPEKKVKSEEQIISSVGRLVPMKCFDVLLEACAILKPDFDNLVCNIIGDGPLREHLEMRVKELGLENVVIMHGKLMQEDIIEILNKTSVFTLPACIRETSDNLPVVLMESLAMEIPTVSTNIRAIPELIIDGKTGKLIEPDDARELAAAIKLLLLEPQQAEKLGKQGRVHVMEQFNAKPNAKILKGLFEKATSQ